MRRAGNWECLHPSARCGRIDRGQGVCRGKNRIGRGRGCARRGRRSAGFREDFVGETFDAVVTGASNKGTYVRVVSPPIEGKLMTPRPGLDVGDRLRVRLSGVNIDRGFIDFQPA